MKEHLIPFVFLTPFVFPLKAAALDTRSDFRPTDFLVSCRLAERTDLTDSEGKELAVLGSDAFINLESYIANRGLVVFQDYIAEPEIGSTVTVQNGYLKTISNSILLSEPVPSTNGIIGLVLAGQTFRILETRKGGIFSEYASFHKIELKGYLKFPLFSDCERSKFD